MSRPRLPLALLALLALLICALPGSAGASYSSSLRRYPYLTDLVKRNVTVNWATTTSITSGTVRYGRPSHDCRGHKATASRVTIQVG